MRCNGSNWAVYSPGSWDGFRNDLWALWALWAGVIMRLEHHLVGGYVRYISPYISILLLLSKNPPVTARVLIGQKFDILTHVHVYVHVSNALTRKSQTLSNLMCSEYICRSKWVGRFWLVKTLSCIVEGGQNDGQNQSKTPLCAHLGQQLKTVSWLILTSVATYLPPKFSCSRVLKKAEKLLEFSYKTSGLEFHWDHWDHSLHFPGLGVGAP